MALDHYVSQVHLRNFYSSKMGGKKMHAIRKLDLKQFPCGSEDVCRIEKGNTNEYLLESRAIEIFLEIIEPRYNESVEKFRSGQIDTDSILVISGYVAYVLSCSPAAMRIGAEPLRHLVEKTARLNQLIVQCAEELVFFRDDREWVAPFVKKNSGFWIEPITERIPMENGELQRSTMRIVHRNT